MRITIVGAGPTGLYLGMALARRGNEVAIVDRDLGPSAGADWDRKGVMQFRLPHFFRHQVRDILRADLPDVEQRVVDAGAIPIAVSPMDPNAMGYRCRRSVFEQALRDAAGLEPGVTFVAGHADSISEVGGRVNGVVVDGAQLDADLVIDASGRNGRFSDALRAPAESSDSGQSYASRQYALRPGAEEGPVVFGGGWASMFDGYQVFVFAQDARTFQFLFVRPSDDRRFGVLREPEVFDAAAAAIPDAAVWIEADRATPIGPPMVGAGLWNSYRGQLTDNGNVGVIGVIYAGDAVMTTNPSAGRGVTTSLQQGQQVVALLDEHGDDFESVSRALDAWTAETMYPWYDDHLRWDAGIIKRWNGEQVDLDGRLPSDMINALADVDPSVLPIVGPFWAMQAGPASLLPLEERARELHKSGHQMPLGKGPTRDELIDLLAAAAPA